MTQEERRAVFRRKAEIGNRRNNACLKVEDNLFKRFTVGDITLTEAITLAWAEGCKYGVDNAEELRKL